MGPPKSRCSDDSDKVSHFHSTQAAVDFPKIIWFLWLQGLENSPPIVTACRDSWLKNNPTWDFRFVTQENLGTYSGIDLASFDHLEKSQLADLIRLDLLLRHGGVWVDATCFCINDLESWLPAYMKSGFFAFEKPGRDRAISSWFLASTPNNALIKSLHSQLTRYLSNPKLSMRRGILEQLLKINLRTTSLWFTPIVVNILRVPRIRQDFHGTAEVLHELGEHLVVVVNHYQNLRGNTAVTDARHGPKQLLIALHGVTRDHYGNRRTADAPPGPLRIRRHVTHPCTICRRVVG